MRYLTIFLVLVGLAVLAFGDSTAVRITILEPDSTLVFDSVVVVGPYFDDGEDPLFFYFFTDTVLKKRRYAVDILFYPKSPTMPFLSSLVLPLYYKPMGGSVIIGRGQRRFSYQIVADTVIVRARKED